MIGRYEYTDAKSNKFWQLEESSDGLYRATWGRIGADGQSTEYDRGTAEKKVREKLAKGYVLVEETRRKDSFFKVKRDKPREEKPAFDFMAELKKVK